MRVDVFADAAYKWANAEEMEIMVQQKPARPAAPIQLKKGGPTTEPSPTLITRNVRRYVAMCAVANQTSCEFPNRKAPKLHGSAAAAEVEGGRHMRSAHANFLAFEVKAKRSRQVVNEQIELVQDE